MVQSYRVLIADDKEMVTKFIVSLLSRYGYRCETAKDGFEALEKIKKNAFDAVITDIVMPQMDGITLTRELVKRSPHLPIMIITGHGEEYSVESTLKAGVREFIKKPFSFPEFIIRFDKMMRDHEMLNRLKRGMKFFSIRKWSLLEKRRGKGKSLKPIITDGPSIMILISNSFLKFIKGYERLALMVMEDNKRETQKRKQVKPYMKSSTTFGFCENMAFG